MKTYRDDARHCGEEVDLEVQEGVLEGGVGGAETERGAERLPQVRVVPRLRDQPEQLRRCLQMDPAEAENTQSVQMFSVKGLVSL